MDPLENLLDSMAGADPGIKQRGGADGERGSANL